MKLKKKLLKKKINLLNKITNLIITCIVISVSLLHLFNLSSIWGNDMVPKLLFSMWIVIFCLGVLGSTSTPSKTRTFSYFTYIIILIVLHNFPLTRNGIDLISYRVS